MRDREGQKHRQQDRNCLCVCTANGHSKKKPVSPDNVNCFFFTQPREMEKDSSSLNSCSNTCFKAQREQKYTDSAHLTVPSETGWILKLGLVPR